MAWVKFSVLTDDTHKYLHKTLKKNRHSRYPNGQKTHKMPWRLDNMIDKIKLRFYKQISPVILIDLVI